MNRGVNWIQLNVTSSGIFTVLTLNLISMRR